MFFGVRRDIGDDRVAVRRWPFALASFLAVFGATAYIRERRGAATGTSVTVALVFGGIAALAAWWLVQRSASTPSTDPEDNPQYRFQGHVARIVQGIEARGAEPPTGRIAFEFDGKRYEFRARWTPGDWLPAQGKTDSEVVIERVDDDLAFVEPWAAIEERL